MKLKYFDYLILFVNPEDLWECRTVHNIDRKKNCITKLVIPIHGGKCSLKHPFYSMYITINTSLIWVMIK